MTDRLDVPLSRESLMHLKEAEADAISDRNLDWRWIGTVRAKPMNGLHQSTVKFIRRN